MSLSFMYVRPSFIDLLCAHHELHGSLTRAAVAEAGVIPEWATEKGQELF